MEISIARLPALINRGILGIIYPPHCHICRKRLNLFGRGVLCDSCYRTIKLNEIRTCDGKIGKRRFEALYSACSYEGVIRKCIHDFKYCSKFGVEKLFMEVMIGFAEKNIDMKRFDWLIPVPLHRVKHRERGFNQSERLAVYISKRFKVPVLKNKLLRTQAGESQIALPKAKRLENTKGSFKVQNPHLMKNKTVLLIDDVFTTGATVNECSRALKAAGTASVEVFTLARSM